MERLTFEFKLDDLANTGEFAGYASTFGNVDLGNDVVAPGAFERTIKTSGGRVPILWQHKYDMPIGVGTGAAEDSKGLKVTGKLLIDDVQQAKEAHALMKAGAIKGLSMGYVTRKSDTDQKTGVRTLKDVDLEEYSHVTFPMNPKAMVTRVKSDITTEREFETFLRDAGWSRNEAKLIVSEGYRAFQKRIETESDEQRDAVISGAEFLAHVHLSQALTQ